MLSRTADSLFWMSRYIERAENLARILDVAHRLDALPVSYSGEGDHWQSAIATAAVEASFYAAHAKADRDSVTRFLISGDNNPASIRRCMDYARAAARSVRNAITVEMWEAINAAYLTLQQARVKSDNASDVTRFIAFIKETSLRFDGAAYRTMLRDDGYWFSRLGLFIERADNTARLLDVKYHLLLPDHELVGGGLDYFQWTALLRSVSAQSSFHYQYRQSVKPWLVADFLILRPEQPRSLVACATDLQRYLSALADLYGQQGPAQRMAQARLARLQNADIESLFQSGLHEFLTGFITENNGLGAAIAKQYLL
jgi:uncharacterized alpha-E superfamily protein